MRSSPAGKDAGFSPRRSPWREVRGTSPVEREPFDAYLPGVSTPIRIASLYEAQIFARRWVIRDKDPVLKALVRRLDRVSGADTAASSFGELKGLLASRGLLRQNDAV
jgi:hypothetical protein